MSVKIECPTCRYTVKSCANCQAILPQDTHGAVKFCDDCRERATREYNVIKQRESRGTAKDVRRRLAALERLVGASTN